MEQTIPVVCSVEMEKTNPVVCSAELEQTNPVVGSGQLEQTDPEMSVKKGENPDETVPEMSLENEGEVVKASDESLVPDSKWEIESPNAVPATSSGWVPFTKSSSRTDPISAEDQATMAVLKLQRKALEACKKFLVRNAGSDSDEDDTDEEEQDEWLENFDIKESKEYEFFEKVFAEDDDLRKYYENNRQGGDFYCLVCGGIGKKLWKRFKHCMALIHHSTGLKKTTKKRAHRAYAHVICKVAGCEVDKLPSIKWKDLDSSSEASRKLLDNLDEKVSESSSENAGEIVKASDESLATDDKSVSKSPNAGISTTSSGSPPSDDIKSSSLSAEEQATVAVLQLQHKALESCQKFLVDDTGFGCDENGKDDISSGGEDEKEDELKDNHHSKEWKEYKFFEKVFAEDDDLRKYYENNRTDGDFYCLVCGDIRKRFKDSVALIQHSTCILKTKSRRAHRAYAQVICKVFGWDIEQLPDFVLKGSDSSLAGSKTLLVEPKKPAVGCIDDSNAEPADNSTDNRVED